MKKPTVTAITSSIGRPELKQCIESVMSQDYPCQHHIYINGKKWHEPARETLFKTEFDRERISFYFMNDETGDCGIGPGCGDVFVAAPYLTSSDYIAFLNDDDWFDPNHISSLVNLCRRFDLGWAFSLRKYVDKKGKFICNDDIESFGYWPTMYDNDAYLVDNSSFFIKRKIACELGPHWLYPYAGDRNFLKHLKMQKVRSGCTGMYTCNYRTSIGHKTEGGYHNGVGIKGIEFFDINLHRAKEKYGTSYPWAKTNIWENK